MDAYRIARLLTLMIIGILSLIKEGLGIDCYTCNSDLMPDCADIKKLSDEDKIPYITKCWQLPDARTKNYTMCRKILQDIEGKKSTVRQCATAGTAACTKRTGTRKIKMEYCECSDDLCNMATPAHKIPAKLLCAMWTLFLTLSRQI